jgi:hypothetical protein
MSQKMKLTMFVVLTGAVVALLTIVCSASAVWGS